jgi:hypothetical protein
MLERAAQELAPFLDEVAFVGGLPPGSPGIGLRNVFVPTDFVTTHGRGGGDHLRSHDLEDIIALVDGRAEIVDEFGGCSQRSPFVPVERGCNSA